jgi:hypothetical protein
MMIKLTNKDISTQIKVCYCLTVFDSLEPKWEISQREKPKQPVYNSYG